MFKFLIKRLFENFGYELTAKSYLKNLNNQIHCNTMDDGIARVCKLTIPSVVIDIGAAQGDWTDMAIKYWPNANYYLFEPLQERELAIQKLKEIYSSTKIEYIKAAVGKEDGVLNFSVTNDLDGSGFYEFGNLRKIPVVTLDSIMLNEDGPYVLKLDTHGYEIPIFEGAYKTLKKTEVIIVEVYGFYVSKEGRLFWEVCKHLDDLGFRLFDIVDVMRRPRDSAFWQCDAFFLRKNHPLFVDNNYK